MNQHSIFASIRQHKFHIELNSKPKNNGFYWLLFFFILHCFGHITIGKIKLIFICSKQCFRSTLLMLTTCCFLYIIRKEKSSTNTPCSMDLLKMCLIVYTKCTEHQRLLCMVKSKKKSFTNLFFSLCDQNALYFNDICFLFRFFIAFFSSSLM